MARRHTTAVYVRFAPNHRARIKPLNAHASKLGDIQHIDKDRKDDDKEKIPSKRSMEKEAEIRFTVWSLPSYQLSCLRRLNGGNHWLYCTLYSHSYSTCSGSDRRKQMGGRWITKPIVEADERARLGLEEGLGAHNFIPYG